MTWNTTYTNTSSTNTGFVYYPVVTSASSLSMGGYIPPAPAPAPRKPPGPLEWLDAEVERTCVLARLAA